MPQAVAIREGETVTRPSMPWEESRPVRKPDEFLSAPDLILKAIHVKLIQFYSFCIELAPVDEPSMADLFVMIDRESEGQFQHLLHCYRQTALFHFHAVLESLLRWKDLLAETAEDSAAEKTALSEEKLRNVSNYLFGSIVIQLFLARDEAQREKRPQAELDLFLARRLANVLIGEFAYVSEDATEVKSRGTKSALSIPSKKNASDLRDADPAIALRREVLTLLAQAVGMFSRLCFPVVADTFYEQMRATEDAPAARLQLTMAMRNVVLPHETAEDINHARTFVTFFTDQLAQKPKLELSQAYSYTLGEVLMSLVELQIDTQPYHSQWREFIMQMYHSVRRGWKKFKDPLASTVLEVGIMCAGQKMLLGQQPIAVLDRLLKLLKVPAQRTATLDCLYFVVAALFRNYDMSEFDINRDMLLEKLRTEIFHVFGKKSAPTAREGVTAMVDLLLLLCTFDVQWGVSQLLLPMLSSEMSLELQLVAMQAFNAIADVAHVTFDKTFAFSKRPDTFLARHHRRGYHTLLRLSEYGSGCFALSETLLVSFQNALGQVILHADAQAGQFYQNTQGKTVEAPKQPYVEVLRTGVACVSRIPPMGLGTSSLIRFLVHKSLHVDYRLAKESRALIVALLATRPAMRAAIVHEVATVALDLPKDHIHLLRLTITLLIELLSTWSDPLTLNVREMDLDYLDEDVLSRSTFSASFLEALALLLLCSPSVHVRNAALNLFEEIARLDSVLPPGIAEGGTRVIGVLRSHEEDILKHTGHEIGPQRIYSNLEEIVIGCSEGEQEDWAHCLGFLVPLLRQQDVHAMNIAYCLISVRLEEYTSSFSHSTGKRNTLTMTRKEGTLLLARGDEDAIDELLLWRNAVLMGGAIGHGKMPACAEELDYKGEMTSGWFIQTVLPSLFCPSERVRTALQLALQYFKESLAFTLPRLVHGHLEGLTRKETSQARWSDVVRAETSRLYRNLTKKYMACNISNEPFEIAMFTFIEETLDFLIQPAQEVQWSLQAQRYDFFQICACLFGALDAKPSSRGRLSATLDYPALLQFLLCNAGYGLLYWESKPKEMRMKEAYLERFKDRDLMKAEERFLSELRTVQYWARQALTELLKMHDRFEAHTLEQDGPVFLYVSSVFELDQQTDAQGQARAAMTSSLRNNLPAQKQAMESCIALSYHATADIARNFTLTVVEAVTQPGDVPYELPPITCLAFYQMTDADLSTRKAATSLLHWISTRFFRTHQMVLYHFVTSQLPEHYTSQMRKMALRFAEAHDDLLLDLVREGLVRSTQLQGEPLGRMATLLATLVTRLRLAELDARARDELLSSLLLLSKQIHVSRRSILRDLWLGLANSQENVKLIMIHLFDLLLDRHNELLLSVAQTIHLYLVEQHADFVFERLAADLHSTMIRPPIQRAAHQSEAAKQPELEAEFPHSTSEKPLTKGDIAFIMLSETILGRSGAWKQHLPQFLIKALLAADHRSSLVYESAKIILVNLLISRAEEELIPGSAPAQSYKTITELVFESQSAPLWSDLEDDAEVLERIHSTLQHCLTILQPVEADLKRRVSDEALQVSTRINLDSHEICRALALYRYAELPAFSSENIHELMGVLLLHVQIRESRHELNTLMELQAIFKYIIAMCTPDQLAAMPKIFWCGIALLRSDISQDYLGGVGLVRAYLDKVDLSSALLQRALHSCYPDSWQPAFPGLAVLLLKGFCSHHQEEESRQLMLRLIPLQAHDIVDADVERTPVTFIVALLPHLITFLGGEGAAEIAESLARALTHTPLGAIFGEYSVYRTSMEGLRRFLLEMASKFARAYFPRYESFTFTLLIGMLEKGLLCHRKTILQIIEALLPHVDLEHSPLFQQQIAVFAPILNFLQGDLWPQALTVLEIILGRSSAPVAPILQKDLPRIRQCLQECQGVVDHWNQLERGKAFVFSALAKVMEASTDAPSPSTRHERAASWQDPPTSKSAVSASSGKKKKSRAGKTKSHRVRASRSATDAARKRVAPMPPSDVAAIQVKRDVGGSLPVSPRFLVIDPTLEEGVAPLTPPRDPAPFPPPPRDPAPLSPHERRARE